ncbi:MAG: hypothetical protein LBH49_02765, partial [Puniceicoccales bacterium]|nr:hypothetical protein [Puniceicoccales bacterium]
MNEKLLNIRNSTINNNNNNITKKQKRSSLIKMFVLVISLGNAISNSSGEPDKKLEQLKAKGYRYKGNITPISHCNPSTPIAPEAQKRLETFMPDLSLDGGLLYIKEFLAEGGLGKTYKGVVTDSNNEITKNVIIKTLKLKNVGRKKNVPTIKHLEREINASSQLIHTLKKYISTPEIDFAKFQGASGIVSIIGYRGCELIQPEIDGYDLSKIYEKGFESKLLPPYDAPFGYHQDTSEALRLSLGFISILMAIHNAGFIHNDIKLENIMLKKSEDGSYDPAIIDLGGLVAIGQRSIIKSSNGGPERINIESKQRLLSKLSNNLAIMEKKIETVEDHITNINNA